MSAGYHRLGANAGKIPGWDNRIAPIMPGIRLVSMAPVITHKPIEVRASPSSPESMELGPVSPKIARQMGYTGNTCAICSSVKMKVSGHCEVCEDCGESSGCS